MALDDEEYGLELAKHDLQQKLESLAEAIFTSKSDLDQDGRIVVESFESLISACQSQLSIIDGNLDIDEVLAFGNKLVDDLGKSETIIELADKMVAIYESPPEWLALQLAPVPETTSKGKLTTPAPRKGLQLKKRFTKLTKVVATVATFSPLTGDKLQLGPGPEIWMPAVDAFSESVSLKVETTILPRTDPVLVRHPLRPLPSLPDLQPEVEVAPFIGVNYPTEIVAQETEGMAERLEFVLSQSHRRALFLALRDDNRHQNVVALLGVIESNLDVDAVSHSGARGPFQDMGGLQGAFGDPDVIENLAVHNLLPEIDHPEYNRILANLRDGVRMDRGTLLDFLSRERNANSQFWQTFLTAQRTLITSTHTAPEIAYFYLDTLREKAEASLNLSDPSEAMNFAIMSYNLGMRHLHTLRRIMNQNGVSAFNTDSVLRFIDRADFQRILRDSNLGDLHINFVEAQQYLARYLALGEILRHNQLIALGSTTG